MHRRNVTLLLALIVSASAYPQSNFKKGYIITLQGDTLQGYVNYKEWTRTPTHFTFKNAVTEKAIRDYTVHDIQKLVIEGYESYERFAVSLSMNEVDFNRFDAASNTLVKVDTVFLKMLAQGSSINLYRYRDKLKERFYVLVPPAATPVELNRTIEVEGRSIRDVHTYRQQLDQLASVYPTYTSQLKALIASTSYSEAGLIKIVNQINDVSETEAVAGKRNYKRGRFFAGAGINYSRISYKGDQLILNANGLDADGKPAYKDETTASSYMPVLSAGYDAFFHPALQRSYFRTELAATVVRSTVNAFYKFPSPYDEELTISYRLTGVFVSLTPQLVYAIYQQRNLSLHVGAGASLRYSVYPTQTYHQSTNKEGPGYSDKTIENFFKMNRLSIIPMVHAGATFRRKIQVSAGWFAMSKMVRSRAINNDGSDIISIKTGSVHLSAAYLF